MSGTKESELTLKIIEMLHDFADGPEECTMLAAQLIVNLSIQKFICPECFRKVLSEMMDEVFSVETNASGHATIELRPEILQEIKDAGTLH